MSKKKKQSDEIVDLEQSEAVEVSTEAPIVLIPFTHWVDKLIKKGKIRDYQDEALLVFFKKQGLKAQEPEEVYDTAFKRF